MKLPSSIPALLLAGGALAKHHSARGGDCDSTEVLSDYSALQRREVGARNTVVRNIVLIGAGTAGF